MNTQELKQARLAFLEDTVKFYSEDISRRAVMNDFTCLYRTQDGRKCAIGRHISDENYIPSLEFSLWTLNKWKDVLSPQIIELEESFLRDIQTLHDLPEYWEVGGLTERGLEKYNSIKKSYELN